MARADALALVDGAPGHRERDDIVKRTIAALLLVGILAGCGGGTASTATVPLVGSSASPTEAAVEPTDEPVESIDPGMTMPPTPKTFAALNARTWKLIVKSPDNYAEKGYVVWACITQFDAATGTNSFRAQAAQAKVAYWFTDAVNVMFVGDETLLSDFVQDDLVTMNVATIGAYSYDTQVGGSTTVPLFQVVKITRKGSCAP